MNLREGSRNDDRYILKKALALWDEPCSRPLPGHLRARIAQIPFLAEEVQPNNVWLLPACAVLLLVALNVLVLIQAWPPRQALNPDECWRMELTAHFGLETGRWPRIPGQ